MNCYTGSSVEFKTHSPMFLTRLPLEIVELPIAIRFLYSTRNKEIKDNLLCDKWRLPPLKKNFEGYLKLLVMGLPYYYLKRKYRKNRNRCPTNVPANNNGASAC